MLGSWNATSSPINTIRFETSVRGWSLNFTKKLLERISPLIHKKLFENIKANLSEKKNSVSNDKAEELYDKLKKETEVFYEQFDKIENIDSIISNIRKYLYPFIKKSKITLINEHQTRETLIKQIIAAKKEVFIATDSIKESGFDNTLLEEVKKGVLGQKKLFLLWGRNYKATEEDSSALQTIEYAREQLGDILITDSNNPMENHSKFIALDGKRIFITSENLLNYGGEKGSNEGRETGLLIENIFITRSIVGAAFLHRHKIFSNKTESIYDLLHLGNQMYYALKELNDDTIKFRETATIKSGINYEIKDNYPKLQSKFKTNIKELKRFGVFYYMLNPYSEKNLWIPFDEIYNDKKNTEQVKLKAQTRNTSIENDNFKKAIEIIESNMVRIPNGKFIIGFNGVKEEAPEHEVIISKDFFASKYLVTQEIWELVMGNLPANITKHQRRPKNPIFHVSFYDVMDFIKKINQYISSSYYIDLPTEAEWEYMCRAGSNSKYTCGNDVKSLDEYAWSKRNANGTIQQVGKKAANKFGLFDIHGLMFEMCKDDRRKYTQITQIDPIGPTDTTMIVTPGGAWGNTPGLRPFFRDYFRCSARNITKKNDGSYRLSFRIIKRIK
jgi:formylglycine-generating enzyme required for sulfatase activity